jgi:hypothetical protein
MHHKPDAIFLVVMGLDALVQTSAMFFRVLPDKIILGYSNYVPADTLTTPTDSKARCDVLA